MNDAWLKSKKCKTRTCSAEHLVVISVIKWCVWTWKQWSVALIWFYKNAYVWLLVYSLRIFYILWTSICGLPLSSTVFCPASKSTSKQRKHAHARTHKHTQIPHPLFAVYKWTCASVYTLPGPHIARNHEAMLYKGWKSLHVEVAARCCSPRSNSEPENRELLFLCQVPLFWSVFMIYFFFRAGQQ